MPKFRGIFGDISYNVVAENEKEATIIMKNLLLKELNEGRAEDIFIAWEDASIEDETLDILTKGDIEMEESIYFRCENCGNQLDSNGAVIPHQSGKAVFILGKCCTPIPHSTTGVKDTLAERCTTYGSFNDNARISQRLKRVVAEELERIHPSSNPSHLTYVQQEAIDVILSKISRVITGNPDYTDNFHDIAGYATLAEQDILEERGERE